MLIRGTPTDVRSNRGATRLAASLIVSVLVTACGSSSINVDAPTTVKCQVSANSSLSSVPATGGSGTITVATTRDCTWSTSTGAAWISLTSAANGQGNGTVDYRVLANSDRAARRGTVAVNDKQLAIDQAAAPCTYSVLPTNSAVGALGGTVTLQVTTSADCAWTTASSSNWLSVTAGGNGSATATITAAPNLGPARTGTVTIAGQTVTVAQADGTALCDVSLGSAAGSVGPGGGTLAVTVTTAPGCHWSATSSAPWVTILSGASGTGTGEVQVSVAANATRADRQATILIGASRFTISQPAAPCNYAIAPTSTAVAAGGGSASVMVTAGPACTWTAISDAPSWITITSGGSGTGNGTVAVSAAANTGAARTGTVTIAGQTFTIMQAAAACSYAIAPASQSVPAGGGPASTMVTAGPACAWTATPNAPWITITSGGSGTGDGTVAVSAAANTGAARTGTVTIAAQTFTIMQAAAACSYAIAPASQSVPAGGGPASTMVTAGTACAWTATPNDPWITITSGGSGTGNGTVAVSAAANTGAARTGAVTITGGQTFTIMQAAAACSYAIAPASTDVTAVGGPASTMVTAGPACAWTATPNVSWITITSGGSGSGNGTVVLSVMLTTGAARTGTVTIAGQTFTVRQAGVACSYVIAPTSTDVVAGGAPVSVMVTAGPACAWTATSNVPWVTITSGSLGLGNGTVVLSVMPNPGVARTGTVTIAGQTFTVRQAAH